MEKLKKWLEPTKNKVIAGLITVLVLAGGGFGVWSLTQSKPVEPVVVFKENIVFEYGHTTNTSCYDMESYKGIKNGTIESEERPDTELQCTDFIDYEKSNFDIIEKAIDIDTSSITIKVTTLELDDINSDDKLETRKAKVLAKLGDAEKEFEFEYNVQDTQAPVIEGAEDMETPFGSELHFEEFIIGTDPVDGKTKLVVEGELDTSKAGQYEMKAIATDNNGNVTEKTFVVTVLEEEKPVEESEIPSTQAPSNTGETSSNANTNKPSNNNGTSNNNNTSAQKPAEPSKPVEKPKEPSKPTEPVKPSETKPEVGSNLIFYKDYGKFEGCKAVADEVKKQHLREWSRNFCDYDGKMYYEPRN